MPSHLVRCPTLAATPYAYAAVADPGTRTVHLAGACPLDGDGDTVGPGDVVAQTRQVMANLRVALAAAGAQVDDVVFVRVLVASSRREDLVDAWQTFRDDFADHDPPATLQGVTVLGYPDQLVEVEAVAAVSG
jgi:enamine deaminase RidA (YjgF/YER057c/UK114 family)